MESIEYKVLDTNGKQKGTVALDPHIFQAPVLEHLVHEVVVWQQNKRRSGTHATLNRALMEGGTKKPWKQKGTGRARAGSNTSSIWVGGAVAFGPQPRDYTTRLSKRSRLQALMSVLTEKVKKERLLIVDSLSLSAAKTKEMAAVLKNLGADKGRALILLGGTTEENEVAIEKSARNIKGVKTLDLAGVNVYDLLYHKYLVCTKDVVKALQERLAARK